MAPKTIRYKGKMIEVEKATIDKLINANEVVIFGSNYCGKSIQAYEIMKKHSDDVVFYELDEMKNGWLLREKLKKKFDYKLIPIIFFNGRFIHGGLSRLEILIYTKKLEEELAKK